MTEKGINTSEFWITSLSITLMFLMVMGNKLSEKDFMDFLMIVVPGYAISRGITKVRLK